MIGKITINDIKQPPFDRWFQVANKVTRKYFNFREQIEQRFLKTTNKALTNTWKLEQAETSRWICLAKKILFRTITWSFIPAPCQDHRTHPHQVNGCTLNNLPISCPWWTTDADDHRSTTLSWSVKDLDSRTRCDFLHLDFFPVVEVRLRTGWWLPTRTLYWPIASNAGNASPSPKQHNNPPFRGFLGFSRKPAFPSFIVLLHMCSGAEMIEGCSLAKFSVKWHLQATAILLRAKTIGSRPMTCEKKRTNVAWKSGRCLSSNEGSSKSIRVAIRPSESGQCPLDTLTPWSRVLSRRAAGNRQNV